VDLVHAAQVDVAQVGDEVKGIGAGILDLGHRFQPLSPKPHEFQGCAGVRRGPSGSEPLDERNG